ncbi:hypothetical protein EDD18DRAFT_1102398 [Armillaria luteobubalina]|uniref:Uncharacterized protein n=1 Tax=Armillaria luteobubalina TaxID=153913 RepID=A0AA39QC86_9AGAR|nr:hypothetical protein EDD18DRAFT_1102398 [Armillaria luteobubalina]
MQEDILGDTPEAIAKCAIQNEVYQIRKNQIRSKFHNERHKGAKTAATNSIGSPAMLTKKKKMRYNLKPVCHIQSIQIYLQCYFQTRVRPLEAETDLIKGEILAALEGIQEELTEAEGTRSPADYLNVINQAPVLLRRFLKEVAEQTGWWFSVLAGGPLPTDNGNIHMQSFRIGQTAQGQNFLDEYVAFSVDPEDPNSQRRTFEESISAPYGHFLKLLFPPEVRAQRALNQAQLDILNEMATTDTPMASPLPTSPSLVAPVTISPAAPLVASSIAPVISPMALPSSSQGVPWVPPPMDPFGSDSLNPALTPFNGLADDLDFFLVGLQQGLPEHPHVPPLPPLPPVYDNSNILTSVPEDSPFPPFPPLPPWPPMDRHNAQQGAPAEDSYLPPLPPLLPMDDNHNAQQGAPEDPHIPPLPPLPPPHDNSSNTITVQASKRACKPRTCREVVAMGWMPPAVGYLSDATLGSEWQNLLVSWQDLEACLQAQGCSPGKGHMGALSSRPSVLSHWLVNCRYNVYPHPPAHFSDKLCKWWNAMQPHWHQNRTGTLPLPVYDRLMDKTLWKGGPNSIVTVLGTLDGDGN